MVDYRLLTTLPSCGPHPSPRGVTPNLPQSALQKYLDRMDDNWAPAPSPAMRADESWPPCSAGDLDAMVCRFELASLENSFVKHHAAAHLTSDAVGFALAMAWAAAAIVRTKSSSEGNGLLACAPHMALAAAVAMAAIAHSQLRSTYLKQRAAIIVVLRVLAVAAGIALQFSVATAAGAGAATVALGAAMLPLQYFQLTLLPLVWRLRARQHLVLNLASLAAVASCNGRLAAAVLAQPPAAKLVSSGHAGELMTVIAWLAAQVCILPCRSVAGSAPEQPRASLSGCDMLL